MGKIIPKIQGFTAEKSIDLMLDVLDRVDDRLLIIDAEGNFIYFNEKYFDYYGQVWAAKGIGKEDIYKQNIFKMEDSDAKILKDIITAQKTVERLYNNPGGEGFEHSVFTDIYPLYEDDMFSGILVVEHNTDMLESLSQELNHYKALNRNLAQQLYDKSELPDSFREVVGDSIQMLRVLKMCAHVAPTNSSVCLLGESGTGKEVLTDAIHRASGRNDAPLIKVNCAAIPENLIESELFGYEKGAFTGANPRGAAGKFELANGGTLFLDEIGEMPLAMQAKLLRVLQEREVTRIGSSKTIKLDFRLITATNKNLEKMIQEGTFREDLYYRICVIPIHIPPLRDRRKDIEQLANHFLAEFYTNPNHPRYFSDEVMAKFLDYSWPGNIRELKNCVERLCILCPDDVIGTDYLPHQMLQSDFPGYSSGAEGQYNLHEIMEKVEYDTIRSVLSKTGGNKSKAIDMLGISKRNFYLKLDKYNLK